MTSPFAVPYSALAAEASLVKVELMRAVECVLESGRYILGPEVAAFEREFAQYCGAAHASGISNGTCSMHLVLRKIETSPRERTIARSLQADFGGIPDDLPAMQVREAAAEPALQLVRA